MKTLDKTCLNCNKIFTIPRCRDWREKCCSSQCKKEYREKVKEENRVKRERKCKICDSIFYPRQNQIDAGQGIFCSRTCQIKEMVKCAHTDEANKKRVASFMKSMDGKYKKGASHPQWTGGKSCAIERTKKKRAENIEYYREKRRKYLSENPDKVREWAASRNRRKLGRLPRGTVKSILSLQKNCCAICKVILNKKYHVDHITPLAKGGTHEKNNIQILCATCNVRKSAKDPIKYMQERGFLL